MTSPSVNGVPVVERHSLGHLTELGAGGEGRVFAVAGRPDIVYKEYLYRDDASRQEHSLVRLIQAAGVLDAALARSSLGPISSVAAWPRTIVREHGIFVGFLMPRIPKQFMVELRIGNAPTSFERPLEWNDLTYESMKNPNRRMSIAYPHDILLRARLAHAFSMLVGVAHDNGIVLGDISGKNLLWSIANGPAIYLIDTDGFRMRFSGGVSSSKQSPDWIDHTLNGRETTIDSDRFKLGLAVYRAIFAARNEYPDPLWTARVASETPQLLGPVDRMVKGERPDAHDWAQALTAFISGEDIRVRPTVMLDRRNSGGAVPIPTEPRSRPTIQLRPNQQ